MADLPPEVVKAKGNPKYVIGRYIMVERVGKGGMGEVWRGFDQELNRWVALKFLLKGSDDDRKRFQREAQLTARLSHPNIVAVHDIGEHDGRPFIAMQFIDGRSLSEDDKLPLRRALEIVRDASNAVHFAHQQGLVHRDIKPANLMVEKGGKTFVTDFGLVRPARVESTISQAGTIMGTPAYMSPEQADGARKLDARTDIYSMGATLYTLVTRKLPYYADSPAQTLVKILTKDPVEPKRLRPDLPSDVQNIILKAMEKEGVRRYRTAADLADDIQHYLDGEPIRAHPPSVGYRLRKQLAKNKALVGVAIVALLLVPILIVLVAARLSSSSAFESAGDEARKAFEGGLWVKAQSAAERALSLRPDADLASIAEQCKERIGKEQEAAARISRGVKLQEMLKPFEQEIKETRAYLYIKAVNIREKLDKLERAMPRLREIATSPEFKGAPDAWILLGMAAYFAGESSAAEEALKQAEAIAPSEFTVCFYLARIYLERSMRSRMTSDRRGTAAEKAKQWTDLALKYMQRASKGTEELDQHVAEVYRAFALGKREEVLRSCESGLQRFQGVGTEEYWNLRGFLSRGREALECYTRAIEIRPHYAWAYFVRANAHLEICDAKGAIEDYSATLRILPRHLDALLNRGTVYNDLREFGQGIDDCTEVLKLDPKNADALFNRGNAYKDLRDFDRAIADYTAALVLSPTMGEALANRGNCKVRQGELEAGLADLDAAIVADPTYAEAWASRANARLAKKDLNGAIDDLKKALEVAPVKWIYRAQAMEQLEGMIRLRDGG